MLHFCVIVLFVPSKHVKKLVKALIKLIIGRVG